MATAIDVLSAVPRERSVTYVRPSCWRVFYGPLPARSSSAHCGLAFSPPCVGQAQLAGSHTTAAWPTQRRRRRHEHGQSGRGGEGRAVSAKAFHARNVAPNDPDFGLEPRPILSWKSLSESASFRALPSMEISEATLNLSASLTTARTASLRRSPSLSLVAPSASVHL